MADAKEKASAATPAEKPAVAAAPAKEETKKRGRKPGSTTKKAAAKKPAAKKTAEKKTTAKKTAEESQETVVLQFYGEDANVNDIIAKIKDAFAAEGHRASSIKKLQVYLKPEERAAYYVINDKQAGKVDLF